MSKGSSSSPKSPYIMTRISPKSPYIMAAKSPKSPMIHEDYKSGCAWRLISIFNFRQGRPKKKLISNRSLDMHDTGNRHTKNRPKALSGVDEKCQCVDDGPPNKTLLLEYGKKNMKGLKEKDISTEQKVKKKHRTESKPRQASRQISVDELLHKLDSAAVTDSLHDHRKHDRDDGIDKKGTDCLDSNQLIQMNDLAEAYVNQKFINGKFLSGGGPSSQSKQFLDALQILNSNKDLFIKLLQDPNSLLAKHIEDLRDGRAKQVTCDAGEPFSTEKFGKQNMEEAAILKKIKFRESYTLSDDIVVLKPGPSSTQTMKILNPGAEGHDSRPTTSFTLGGIGKKLRNAIGVSKKEQRQISMNDRSYKASNGGLSMEESGQGMGMEMFGRSSLREIDSESGIKRKDKIGRTKSLESSIGHETALIGESLEVPSLIDFKKPNDQKQIHDSSPISSKKLLCDTKAHESICSCTEEINLVEVPSELENNNKANLCREDESLESSRLDSPPPLESESSTSSSAVLNIQKVEDINSTMDGAELPSPVSVLERFCIEDITSPANITSQSAELPVQPQQISFEEDCSGRQRTLSTSIDEHGSLTEYVRCVVKAASLNWDELSLKSNLSDQLLEPSIYDEFGVSCSDHGLLFDCINEILLQVYQSYFRFMKPNSKPFSVEEHVVREVVKCFDFHLLKPQSQTLVNLAEKDLAKSTTWMDIRINAEDIVAEMAEGVLEELIMETVSQLQLQV